MPQPPRLGARRAAHRARLARRTARVWEATTDLEALIAKARQRTLRELMSEERTSAMLP
jgi:hypothetical protein